MHPVFRSQIVGDAEVFYREAGPADGPAILLLHGFPTASHMFRDLIPLLSETYRVIAPDLPGFGNTKAPPRGQFTYSFDALADVVAGFVDALDLQRYALYVFDYGAPVGFRLAMRYPERVSAIISQNGNAYLEAISVPGRPGRLTGGTRRHSTAKPAALRSPAKPFSIGNITTGPMRRSFRRMATPLTWLTWRGRGRMKSSLTWFWITAAMSRSTPHFRNISARIAHLCWLSGAKRRTFPARRRQGLSARSAGRRNYSPRYRAFCLGDTCR